MSGADRRAPDCMPFEDKRMMADSVMCSPLEFPNLGVSELNKSFTGNELRAVLNLVRHTAVGPDNMEYGLWNLHGGFWAGNNPCGTDGVSRSIYNSVNPTLSATQFQSCAGIAAR
uniref:Uncharacterized protein n=1 Tax=Timema monikensis TaxID=170555 RepID=A0A7R9HR39_9NEOP|nr:unnamed protein product [Timema monikensis]